MNQELSIETEVRSRIKDRSRTLEGSLHEGLSACGRTGRLRLLTKNASLLIHYS